MKPTKLPYQRVLFPFGAIYASYLAYNLHQLYESHNRFLEKQKEMQPIGKLM